MDLGVPILFNGLQFITVNVYFDAQIKHPIWPAGTFSSWLQCSFKEPSAFFEHFRSHTR